MSPIYETNKAEIEYFSKMEVDIRSEYNLSALYFFGFVEKSGIIEGVKFHFITRHCANSDILHKNIRFDDTYYGAYINNSDVLELKLIMDVSDRILSSLGGHLWMVGLDYFRNGAKKYKVYIKEPTSFDIECLAEILSGDELFCKTVSQLHEFYTFRKKYPEYIPEGIAIGIHSGIPAINFYFRYINDNSHMVREE